MADETQAVAGDGSRVRKGVKSAAGLEQQNLVDAADKSASVTAEKSAAAIVSAGENLSTAVVTKILGATEFVKEHDGNLRQSFQLGTKLELMRGDTGQLAHSSSTPTLQFSSPRMEQIIKEAQAAMAMHTNMVTHTNMVKQPIVTLNKSVFEVPTQTMESCGEHGVESGQLMLSTANNSEVIKPNVKDMVIKSKFWADQSDHDDDEDWGIEYDGGSTDDLGQESDSEDMHLYGSLSLPREDASATPRKLNSNAPAFIPSNTSGVVSKTGQQQ